MPEPFEKFVYPNLTFNLYGNPKRFQADLIQQFPQEQSAIRRYFRDLPKAATALFLHTLRLNGNWLFKSLGYLGKLWSPIGLDLTTKDYLDRHFTNPQLKALLVSQWGDYGVPPAHRPFAVHATIVMHYLNGAFYPVGGAGSIAHSVKAIVTAQGGRFLLNREVTEILIEKDRAIGVNVRKVTAPIESPLETYYAPIVISNTGAAITYLKLIPADYPIAFRESLRQFVHYQQLKERISQMLIQQVDRHYPGFAKLVAYHELSTQTPGG
jgi:all-trans-retinol 13,14-reductase